MQKTIKNTICYMSAIVAAVSLVTVALGNSNVLAQSQPQSCINGDGVNCVDTPPSSSVLPVKPNVSISLLSSSSNPQNFESRLKKTDRCGWSLWLVFTTVCLAQKTTRVPASWVFTVVRSGDISEPASVKWKLLPDGSTPASVPSDFIKSESGTLNFRAGVRAVDFSLTARNDWSFEAEKEYFKICLDNTQSSGLFVGSSPLCESSFIRDDDGPCEDNAVSQFDLLLRLVCVLTVDTIVLTLTLPVAIVSLVSLSVVGIAALLLTGRADGVITHLNGLSATLNTVSDKVRRALTAWLSNPPITQLPLF